ncbi:hypothetical protein [Streptomyces sp. cmx-18-6]|uniref:hypothetical protein n=1 Tax=Streptomyces sp. cmx-18-6 TaxID=2790930 RepID=UPI0039812A85
MTARRRLSFALSAVACAALLAGCGGGEPAPDPVKGEGKDLMPSRTAQDWVTYADHVVVATPTSEKELAPDQSEIDRGEGIIGREVHMKVEKVLWSRADAAQPAPASWPRNSSGWVFEGGDVGNRAEFALTERPRIELGHRYIIALAWQGAKCSEGDAEEPARWMGLGEGSTVPYDDDTIGKGEMEGEEQSAGKAAAVSDSDDPEPRLEDELAGKDSDALVSALRAVRPAVADREKAPAARSLASTCG